MARITTPANFGYESYFLVAEQSAWGTPAVLADLHPKIYEATAIEINRISEPFTPTRLKGNTSPVKNVQMMIQAAGTINFNVHTSDMAFWLRQMLMADSVDSELNGAEEIRAAASFTSAATALTDPSSVLSDDIPCGRLVFTFSSTASGRGDMTVTGRDQQGLRLSETIPLRMGASTEIRAAAAYTSAKTAISDDPDTVLQDNKKSARLIFTFSSAATGTGSLIVEGDDAAGNTITETITITTASGDHLTFYEYAANVSYTVSSGVSGGTLGVDLETGRIARSKFYYMEDVSITVPGAVSGGTLAVNADPETYTHDIALSRDVLEGLSMEVVKGNNTPNLYDSMLVTGGTVSLGDTIALALTFLGREGDLRHSISGVRGTSSPISTYTRPDSILAANWNMGIEINGDLYAVSTASLAFDNNITFPETAFQKSVYYPPPDRAGNRTLTLTPTLNYNLDNDLDSLARGDEITAKMMLATQPKGGAYYLIEFDMPYCELVGFPDPGVGGEGRMFQSPTIRAYSGTADGNDELTTKVISREQSIR